MKNENIWPRLIGQYRKRHALTQEDFAKRFGVTQQTVSRWEAGQQAPGLDVQTTLRTALGLGALPASIGFGVVWERYGAHVAFMMGAGLAALATVLLVVLVPAQAREGT